jgi:hypothetical protein
MTITRTLVFIVTLLASCSVVAQSDEPAPRRAPVVYKCTGADGNVVFSDAPCPATSKAQQVDTSAALRTGSGGHNAEIAAAASGSDCQRSAHQSAYGTIDADIESSNSHIAEYRKRQGDLASMKAYAADGSGNLIDDPAAQKASAELDAAIAKEQNFQRQAQADAAAKYEAAAKACEAAAAKNAQSQQDKK